MRNLIVGLFLQILSLSLVNAQSMPKTGAVIDTVHCLSDPQQSYSLYLPSRYDTSILWPAVFIYEPAARGSLPVRKYAVIAEKYGYVLISSNNSKNGSWDIAFAAGDAMFQDALERYSLNPDRIYTSGFSGGARVATAVAVLTGKISGVIACGAGMPNVPHYRPVRGANFDYISIVGNKDMNFLELQLVEKMLDELPLNNKRIVFDGVHQWPPANAFQEALLWLNLQAYNRKALIDYNPRPAFIDVKNRGDSLMEMKHYLQAHEVYSEVLENYDHHLDMENVHADIALIVKSKEFKRQQKTNLKIQRQEREYQSKYYKAFENSRNNRLKVNANDSTAKTRQWWSTEVDRLKRMTQKGKQDRVFMAYRLLNFVWAKFAESSFTLTQQGDLTLAIEFTKIWVYAEPNSTWAHWSMAKLYGQSLKIDLMVEHLETIHKLNPGLKRKTIMSQKIFAKCISHPPMIAFLKRLE